ncbi:transposase [Frankia sp. AgB1.9]|uniref:transposase n=1 Tax=unclassified Frankia TaxID=2632575 RepID=UPI0019339FBA|nr:MULTISPECIES: transposase [unclassified Frankia]MBL7487462.1 transposase [Frankia sp. AgW1.1]MBL7547424.1 transposase [Frankia sp. AgB1.9]MBL7618801.1 transposase [Frankia sp. AgB1.8]
MTCLRVSQCGPPTASGEVFYAGLLARSLRPGMIMLADRNFGYQPLVTGVAATGADLLVRVKIGRRLPVCRRLGDGSWISRIGQVEVRVVRAEITIATTAGRRTGLYQLVTTVTDSAVPTVDLIRLYHDRWEIETVYLELKATILDGRVLRARTPTGLDQEVHALLCAYQALRLAIADATLTSPGLDPDRASFTIALETARDQITQAAGVIADSVIDLVGKIGRAVLARPAPTRQPPRRQTRDLQLRGQHSQGPYPRPQPQRHPEHRDPQPRDLDTTRPDITTRPCG